MTLSEEIRGEIAARGPMTFRRFMDLALYDQTRGYYRRGRDPFGVSGDFFTNSQLQPVFGRLIAQRIERWREGMGSPENFSVVELGAGRGETSAVLGETFPKVQCVEFGEELPAHVTGVIFSNEFFDALPVHAVVIRDREVLEQYVDAADGGFRFVEGAVSDSQVRQYVERHLPGLEDGQQIEVSLAALDHLERMAASLDRGYIVTIDYGYTVNEILRARRFPAGSLMSYRKHQASEDVLQDPGSRDLTAHVNFTALQERGRDLGLESEELQSQAAFLMDAGERDQFASALSAASESESFRLRMQLKTLLFGLGETFRVLVQRKG